MKESELPVMEVSDKQTELLKEFAFFVKNEYFDEFITRYLDLIKRLDVPLMHFFSGLSDNELKSLSKISLEKFLNGFINENSIELAIESLKNWEEDKLPGISKESIQPSDLVLIYFAQKTSLIHFVPAFTDTSETAISIVSAIEKYFLYMQDKGMQLLFKIQNEIKENLKASEDRYRDLFESSSNLIHKADEKGNFLYVNKAWLETLEYTQDDLKDLNIRNILQPEYRDLFNLRKKYILQGFKPETFETAFKTKSGKTVFVEGSISIKTDGDKLFTRGIFSDITIKKEYQKKTKDFRFSIEEHQAQLQKLNRQLAQAQKLANIGNWEWDVITDEVTWSDELYRIYGLPPGSSKITYFEFLTYIHPEDRDFVNQTIGKALEHGIAYNFFHRIMVHGEVKILNAIGEAVKNEEGKIILLRGTGQDVTKLKTIEETLAEKAAELEKSNKELEQFAYIASHDLQEPLRKVIVFGERIKNKYFDKIGPEGADELNRMQRAASRMQILINDLLSYSRVSQLPEEKVPMVLNELLEEVINDLELIIKERKVTIEYNLNEKVKVIPGQIKQLFQNLISNAIKFAKSNVEPEIKISSCILNNKLVILFSDNGIGIEKAYAKKIFIIFQRLHSREQYEGTGIGLALCKRIMENHNGTITASSNENGATFTMEFPLKNKS